MSQHVEALARAQQVRTAAQTLRREIACLSYEEGRSRVAELLCNPTETVARMRLNSLLTAIRRVSDRTALRLIDKAGLPRSSWTRRIGPVELDEVPLTERQRLALAAVVTPITPPDDTYAIYLLPGDLEHWRQLVADDRGLEDGCPKCARIRKSVATAEFKRKEPAW